MDRLCPQVFAFFPSGACFIRQLNHSRDSVYLLPYSSLKPSSYIILDRLLLFGERSLLFLHLFLYFFYWLQSNNSLLFSFSLTDTGSRLFEDTAMTLVPLDSPHLPE
jgi:hypothetical protein